MIEQSLLKFKNKKFKILDPINTLDQFLFDVKPVSLHDAQNVLSTSIFRKILIRVTSHGVLRKLL